MALLLDLNGFVTETSSGNLFVVNADRLYTPAHNTLPGITQSLVIRLATAAGYEVVQTDLTVQDVQNADEAFLTSSTYGIMPATQCNQHHIGTGLVGANTQRLTELLRRELGME